MTWPALTCSMVSGGGWGSHVLHSPLGVMFFKLCSPNQARGTSHPQCLCTAACFLVEAKSCLKFCNDTWKNKEKKKGCYERFRNVLKGTKLKELFFQVINDKKTVTVVLIRNWLGKIYFVLWFSSFSLRFCTPLNTRCDFSRKLQPSKLHSAEMILTSFRINTHYFGLILVMFGLSVTHLPWSMWIGPEE